MVALSLPETIHFRVKYPAKRSFGSWNVLPPISAGDPFVQKPA